MRRSRRGHGPHVCVAGHAAVADGGVRCARHRLRDGELACWAAHSAVMRRSFVARLLRVNVAFQVQTLYGWFADICGNAE